MTSCLSCGALTVNNRALCGYCCIEKVTEAWQYPNAPEPEPALGGTVGGGTGKTTTPEPPPTTKATNPKDAAAFGRRIAWSVLPVRALTGAALALAEGAYKYARHNYRVDGVRASVYFDACLRHLFAWWEGEDVDPASGLHHVDKAIAGLLVLRDAMLGARCTDDRPPSAVDGWVDEANERYSALLTHLRDVHGEPRPPFTRET